MDCGIETPPSNDEAAHVEVLLHRLGPQRTNTASVVPSSRILVLANLVFLIRPLVAELVLGPFEVGRKQTIKCSESPLRNSQLDFKCETTPHLETTSVFERLADLSPHVIGNIIAHNNRDALC